MTATEHVIELSSGRSRYLEAGDGNRAVLLLHGMGVVASANDFMFVIDDLAQAGLHVYALDQLGYGKGERELIDAPTFDLTVDHVREFLDELGLSPISVVGHSAGGWIAALLAYESPDRVEDLVLLCSAGLNAEIAPNVAVQELPTDAAAARQRVDRQVSCDVGDLGDRVDGLLATMLEMASQPGALHSLDSIVHQMTTWEIRRRYLLQRRLPKITARTLMAWGRGDTMDPWPTWTSEYGALDGDMTRSSKPWVVPGATFALLPTGHAPHWEAPDHVVRLLVEFFAGDP